MIVCLSLLLFIGTIVVSTTYFAFLCLFYAMMDLTGKPVFLTKYKIQENEEVLVTLIGCVGISVLSIPD